MTVQVEGRAERTHEEIQAVTVGVLEPLTAPIPFVDPNKDIPKG